MRHIRADCGWGTWASRKREAIFGEAFVYQMIRGKNETPEKQENDGARQCVGFDKERKDSERIAAAKENMRQFGNEETISSVPLIHGNEKDRHSPAGGRRTTMCRCPSLGSSEKTFPNLTTGDNDPSTTE